MANPIAVSTPSQIFSVDPTNGTVVQKEGAAPGTEVTQALPISRYIGHDSKLGFYETSTLEALQSKLKNRNRKQKPMDIQRMPRTCHVRFGNPDVGGRASIQLITPKGLDDPMLFTDLGLQQLAEGVTGTTWLKKMAKQVKWPMGPAMASADFAHFNVNNEATEKVRTFRVVTKQVDGKSHQVVRSVVSEKYTVYDNLTFIDDLMGHKLTRDLPVISHDETDTMMRIRFALDKLPEDGMDVGVPIRMLEVWNSEVGQGAGRFVTGLFTPHCLNGLHSTSKEHSWRHVHSGSREAFDTFVESALDEVEVVSGGIMEQYKKATEITCQDLYAWGRDKLLAMYITGKACARVERALEDPRTRQDDTLSQLVDACTLAAQEEKDLYLQSAMENAAYRLLVAGIAESKKSRGAALRVPVAIS